MRLNTKYLTLDGRYEVTCIRRLKGHAGVRNLCLVTPVQDTTPIPEFCGVYDNDGRCLQGEFPWCHITPMPPTVDWSRLPSQARYVAKDEDGCWWWYAEPPQMHADVFEPAGDYVIGFDGNCNTVPSRAISNCRGIDWRASVIARPS